MSMVEIKKYSVVAIPGFVFFGKLKSYDPLRRTCALDGVKGIRRYTDGIISLVDEGPKPEDIYHYEGVHECHLGDILFIMNCEQRAIDAWMSNR